MSKKLDVNHLIAEVKQRPALWDVRLPEYKDRAASALLWREISDVMGCDVEQCKRKWKNIRDAYRAEVRRTERRVQRLKLEGHDDPKVNDSKWAFFKPMSFMSESKRKRYSTPPAVPNELSSDSHEAYMAEQANSVDSHLDMDDYCQIKMEHHTTDEEGELNTKHDSSDTATARNAADTHHHATPVDDDEANDKLFEQFQSVATPQAARRLSGTLTLSGNIGSNSPPPSSSSTPAAAAATAATATSSTITAIVQSNDSHTSAAVSTASAPTNSNCKCSQRQDQVHFLEDLEREEQQLMQSTRRDITRASSMSFFGDSDYNFLVSFLPQMKRLSELQNLQFRAKVSELMLHIMAQPSSVIAATAALPSYSCISTPPLHPHQRHPAESHHHTTHTTHHVHFSDTPPPSILHHHHHQPTPTPTPTTVITSAQQPQQQQVIQQQVIQQLPQQQQQQQQQSTHVTEATSTWNPNQFEQHQQAAQHTPPSQ